MPRQAMDNLFPYSSHRALDVYAQYHTHEHFKHAHNIIYVMKSLPHPQ